MKVLRYFVMANPLVCAVLLCLLLPFPVQAGEKLGIYITPKFSMGFMNWQAHGDGGVSSTMSTETDKGTGHKGSGSWGFDSGKNNTVLGGTLAVGYDFYPNFDVPVRVELEYGRYSDASGSTEYTLSPAQIDQALGVSNSQQAGRTTWMEADIKLRNIQTLMLNAYWDFHNSTSFTPYIGAGVGLAFIQAQGSFPVELYDGKSRRVFYDEGFGMKDVTNFAWQVGAGCSYAFNDTVALDLGYRFMGMGSVESNTSCTLDVNYQKNKYTSVMDMHGKGSARDIYMHQVNLGLRISF